MICAHLLLNAECCNVVSGWEKELVEKNVQDSGLRIWIEASGVKFGS